MFHFKRVMRYDPTEKKLRLFRLIWDVGNVGDGVGYSGILSFSLLPRLWAFDKDWHEWRLTLLGISIHTRLSYGGRFV